MTGREHVSIGVASTALVVGGLQFATGGVEPVPLLSAMLAAAAGSLAPDMDHPNSLASMSIPAALIASSLCFLGYRWYEASHPGLITIGVASLPRFWVVAAWTALAVGLLMLVVSYTLGTLFGHRGRVHSIGAGFVATVIVLLGLAVFRAPLWLALPFAWGWATHLLTDARTPAGLSEALWPLGNRSE